MSDHAAKPSLGNFSYDVLQNLTRVILPGLSALYAALGAIWGFPNVEQIVGTVAALNVFLGLVATVSHKNYVKANSGFDGQVLTTTDDEGTSFRLVLETPLDEAVKNGQVVFKVAPEGASQ
jgi:hypothetical protein